MISRTTVKLKKLRGKHVTVETKRYRIVKIKKPEKLPQGSLLLIPSKSKSGGSNVAKKKPGRPRKPGRPKGSKTKKGRKKKRRLPPRIKTGKRKGQFKKRKGSKSKKGKKKGSRRRRTPPRDKKGRFKKRGNPNNCW